MCILCCCIADKKHRDTFFKIYIFCPVLSLALLSLSMSISIILWKIKKKFKDIRTNKHIHICSSIWREAKKKIIGNLAPRLLNCLYRPWELKKELFLCCESFFAIHTKHTKDSTFFGEKLFITLSLVLWR